MHGLPVQVKKRLPLHITPLLKILWILIHVFVWLYLVHPYLFLFCLPSSSSLLTVLDAVSSNTYNVLSLNPYSNGFLSVDLICGSLPYSGRTDRSGELCQNSVSNGFTQIANFLVRSLTVMLRAPVF